MAAAQRKPQNTFSVEEVAKMLQLKAERSKGKIEWHGANPWGEGATEDGFILYPEGNAYDRKIDKRYTSIQVAEMAEIPPESYAPVVEYNRAHGFNSSYVPRPVIGIIGDGEVLNDQPTMDEAMPVRVPEKKLEKTYDTRSLADRGFTEETLRHFHISEFDDWYEYPTFQSNGEPGRSRQKMRNPEDAGLKWAKNKKPFKYRWKPGDNDPQPLIYNINALENEVECWLVGGEPDVWACEQVGIHNAVSGFGETRLVDRIIKELSEVGIETIHIALDNDKSGHEGAIKAADACKACGIEYTLRDIPGADGKDVFDLFNDWKFDPQKCRQTLEQLQYVTRAKQGIWRGDEPKPEEKPSKKKSSSKDDKTEYLLTILEEETTQVFMGDDEEAYMELTGQDGIIRTYPVGDSKMNALLFSLFYRRTGRVLEEANVNRAMLTLKGMALSSGKTRQVWIRTAEHDGSIFIDLNNDVGQVVEISPDIPGDGWRIIQNPPVQFRRPKGFLPLPIPVHGGDITKLKKVINAEDDESWCLTVAWLIYALHPPTAPYPVLAYNGEMGTGKSMTSKMVRKIVDPNFTPLIGGSIRDDRDLAIMARNSLVIGFDNISGLQKWQSDALCQIVTEGCFRTRKLHSNDEEVLFNARRPIILNGIDQLVGREDFQQRSLVCTLPVIDPKFRRDEQEVWREFNVIWPELLGWIFTAMAQAMAFWDQVVLETKPRMADFYKWVMAAAMSGMMPFTQEQFAGHYSSNRRVMQESAIELSPLAKGVRQLAEILTFFEGSPTDILKLLNKEVPLDERDHRSWPADAARLSIYLNRIAEPLRSVGIDIKTGEKDGKGQRIIKIKKVADK